MSDLVIIFTISMYCIIICKPLVYFNDSGVNKSVVPAVCTLSVHLTSELWKNQSFFMQFLLVSMNKRRVCSKLSSTLPNCVQLWAQIGTDPGRAECSQSRYKVIHRGSDWCEPLRDYAEYGRVRGRARASLTLAEFGCRALSRECRLTRSVCSLYSRALGIRLSNGCVWEEYTE